MLSIARLLTRFLGTYVINYSTPFQSDHPQLLLVHVCIITRGERGRSSQLDKDKRRKYYTCLWDSVASVFYSSTL